MHPSQTIKRWVLTSVCAKRRLPRFLRLTKSLAQAHAIIYFVYHRSQSAASNSHTRGERKEALGDLPSLSQSSERKQHTAHLTAQSNACIPRHRHWRRRRARLCFGGLRAQRCIFARSRRSVGHRLNLFPTRRPRRGASRDAAGGVRSQPQVGRQGRLLRRRAGAVARRPRRRRAV